jgi:prepilin-type N-terminal cleavage/methylation domain-containing protein
VYKSSGFTIIELIVVVVIIAILSTISILSYSGVRERAEATAIISHVRQYVNIFETYIVDNGKSPQANWRCLGDASTLPAVNGYAENYCFKPSNSGTDTGDFAPASSSLMATLKAVNVSLPSASFPEALCSQGRTCRGLIYDSSTSNFPNNPSVIVYFTKLQYCPIGDKVAWWTSVDPSRGSGCAYRLSINHYGLPR